MLANIIKQLFFMSLDDVKNQKFSINVLILSLLYFCLVFPDYFRQQYPYLGCAIRSKGNT